MSKEELMSQERRFYLEMIKINKKNATKGNSESCFLFRNKISAKTGNVLIVLWIVLAIIIVLAGMALSLTKTQSQTIKNQVKSVQSMYRSEGLLNELWYEHQEEVLKVISKNIAVLNKWYEPKRGFSLQYPYERIRIINRFDQGLGLRSEIQLLSKYKEILSAHGMDIYCCPPELSTSAVTYFHGAGEKTQNWMKNIYETLPFSIKNRAGNLNVFIYEPNSSEIELRVSAAGIVLVDGNDEYFININHRVCIYSPFKPVNISIYSTGVHKWAGVIITKGDLHVACTTKLSGFIWLIDGSMYFENNDALKLQGICWMGDKPINSHRFDAEVDANGLLSCWELIPELMSPRKAWVRLVNTEWE